MCNLQEHINALKYTIPDVMRLIHMWRNLTYSVCEWGVERTYSTQLGRLVVIVSTVALQAIRDGA